MIAVRLAAAAAFALSASSQAPVAAAPVVQVDYANPGLSPSQWTITLHRDGTAHFRSQTAKPPEEPQQVQQQDQQHRMDTPPVDRDFRVSAGFAARVFDTAERHNRFNQACESHLKVAFQGWKTFTYSGPEGQGACTFNYSKDKEIEDLAQEMEGVGETLLEGARLEMLLQHDRLGLDAEMEFLTDAAADGRVQQIGAIRDILERLTQDDEVLERVRRRARSLLEHAQT